MACGTAEPGGGASPPSVARLRGVIAVVDEGVGAGRDLRFRGCGQTAALPLRPVDAATGELLHRMMTSGSELYAEFLGRPGGRVPSITFTRLIFAGREGGGCGRVPGEYELRAHGNEPFWSVEVSGGEAHWRTAESPQPETLAITAREHVGDGWLLSAASDARQMEISFAATSCRDSMAGSWFGYTVQARIDGIEYRGCGRSGGVADPAVAAQRR